MNYLYDNLFAALLAATLDSTERQQAVMKHPGDVLRTSHADGTQALVLQSHDFVLTILSNTQGHWGFDWVWTDTARK
jgi:hypothetical protein